MLYSILRHHGQIQSTGKSLIENENHLMERVSVSEFSRRPSYCTTCFCSNLNIIAKFSRMLRRIPHDYDKAS